MLPVGEIRKSLIFVRLDFRLRGVSKRPDTKFTIAARNATNVPRYSSPSGGSDSIKKVFRRETKDVVIANG